MPVPPPAVPGLMPPALLNGIPTSLKIPAPCTVPPARFAKLVPAPLIESVPLAIVHVPLF